MVKLYGGFTWRVNDFRELMFDKLKECNANALAMDLNSQLFVDNALVWRLPAPMTQVRYSDITKQGVQWLRDRGLKLVVWAHQGPGSQKGAVYYGKVITEPAVANQWISQWSQVISSLKPDSFQLMDECPSPEQAENPNLTFKAYRDWALKCIDIHRSVKPDLNIMLTSIPFWDMRPMAQNPINRDNISYSFHIHYFTTPTSPGPTFPWAVAYDEGRFSEAKALLESWLLDEHTHVQDALDAGLDLVSVFGSDYRTKPNSWNYFLDDMYDFCRRHRINSYFHHSYNTDTHTPPGTYATGIWNVDITDFNVMGELFCRNMPTPTPSLSRIVGTLGFVVAITYLSRKG